MYWQGLGREIEFNVREVRSPDGHVFRCARSSEVVWCSTLPVLGHGHTFLHRGHAFHVLLTSPPPFAAGC